MQPYFSNYAAGCRMQHAAIKRRNFLMKKWIALALATAVCLGTLTACGSGGTPNVPGSVSQSDLPVSADPVDPEKVPDIPTEMISDKLTGTLKLGTIGPLTGGAALYGTSVANAADIAVEEINAFSDAFHIELNNQDDEHDAEKSVNAYNVLKDWGVQVIVGSTTSTPCAAVAAEAFSDRMFLLTPSASSPDATKGKDNVFQVCFSDPNMGVAPAHYIAETFPDARISMIYNNSDAYSTGIAQAFLAKAAELNLNVVSTTTFPDDNTIDFSVQLSKAMSKGTDLLFLPIYYTPASLIMHQADAMGYDSTIIGVDGMDGILGLKGFDTDLAEGVIMLTPFSATAGDPATVSFVSKYQAKHKEIPSQFAADSYDAVYILYAALSYYAEANNGLDVTNLSHEELCSILTEVLPDPNFSVDGLTGIGMTWSANGEVNKMPSTVMIKDGKYVGI